MLDNFRHFGRSWTAKILLGVLVIAVAGFGIPSVFLDMNANTVARVGDQNITVRDFDRLYRGQVNQFAQQTGMAPTAQQALAMGLPTSTIASLANEVALEILARDLQLGASDDKLAELVRRDPNFASALGLFDTREFSSMLRQSGFTEAEYLNTQRKFAMRQQIGVIFNGAVMPKVGLDIARAFDNDARTIEFAALNPVLFEESGEPDEADLEQFFEENKSRFRTVETRVVSLLPLTADALARGVELDDAEVVAEYERTAAQFIAPERRTIHQLALPDEDAAQVFADALEAGDSFAAAVSQAGLQTGVNEIGTVAEAELTDPVLAEAAFALDANGYAVVESTNGPRVIWVSAITEAGQAPLDVVRGQLESTLRGRKAQEILFTVYDEIEEARAAFLPVADVAERHGLATYDLELTASGAELATVENLPDGATRTIVDAVFAASPDARVTPAINLGSNRTVFYELKEVREARDRTLDEARDEVIVAWQELQTDMAMTRAAEDMVAAIDEGGDLFSVALEFGQVPQSSAPFTRNGGDATLDPDVMQAAFQGGEGHAGYVPTRDGDIVVYQVTEVDPAPADAPSQVAQTLESDFSNLLLMSFVTGLREDLSVRINEEAVNRVIGLE
ncbi:MAG TPA: SurA N-terminal domain-containing protein [Pelagibacterium sp.]|uniref:SurA N-terminal domain-containing protein n=1 Tax=Pelagibacterium sp. TaxID=1967288 RepID=UPI002B7638B1|nr:SurA N-terminal domain-containing protein [Pelagibacterium sp.]HWJ88435.1 SurA N-terminal domain-containing protein [Pelagibacterium sp.]